MPDDSNLDNKYFIDKFKYNCPFCNRRHVAYTVRGKIKFDWSNEKECFIYTVTCDSCGKKSLHLSYRDIPLRRVVRTDVFDIESDEDLDSMFFYSVPTSFFSLNNKIPRILRELFIEAEGCLKGNFLTGASACVRKLIYEMAVIEGAEGVHYDQRVKSLKIKRRDIESEHFDTLLTIQEVTSEKVHEESYDGWESRHIQILLSTLKEILDLMYVIPALREDKRIAILALKEELKSPKKH